MTRKDYVRIANAIAASIKMGVHKGDDAATLAHRMVIAMGATLKLDNPNFNRKKWEAYITEQLEVCDAV